MLDFIVQTALPLITAFVMLINSIGSLFGNSAVIPYNPERTDIVISEDAVTDIEQILAVYNEAVKNTGWVLGTVNATIAEAPEFDMDGGTEPEFIEFINEIFEDTISASSSVLEVPGEGNLTASDVDGAKMCEKDGKIFIKIEVKDYECSLNDTNTSNPITNAFGVSTTSEIDTFGKYVVTVGENTNKYDDCEIECIIENGKIIYGDWDYDVEFYAEDLALSIFGSEMKYNYFSVKYEQDVDI